MRELRVSRAYLAIEGGTRVKARGLVGQIADSWSPGGRSGPARLGKLAQRARGRGAGGEVRELRVSRAYLAIEWATRVGARGLVGQIAVLWPRGGAIGACAPWETCTAGAGPARRRRGEGVKGFSGITND